MRHTFSFDYYPLVWLYYFVVRAFHLKSVAVKMSDGSTETKQRFLKRYLHVHEKVVSHTLESLMRSLSDSEEKITSCLIWNLFSLFFE